MKGIRAIPDRFTVRTTRAGHSLDHAPDSLSCPKPSRAVGALTLHWPAAVLLQEQPAVNLSLEGIERTIKGGKSR